MASFSPKNSKRPTHDPLKGEQSAIHSKGESIIKALLMANTSVVLC